MLTTTTTNAAIIEVTVAAGTPSRDWQRVATVRARRACEAAGVNWVDADIVVTLPEIDRFMVKAPGFLSLAALA